MPRTAETQTSNGHEGLLMKCERCGKELSDIDLYCSRCGKAVFPQYMDEEDVWAYYRSDEELQKILEEEGEGSADPGSAEPENRSVSSQEKDGNGKQDEKPQEIAFQEAEAIEPAPDTEDRECVCIETETAEENRPEEEQGSDAVLEESQEQAPEAVEDQEDEDPDPDLEAQIEEQETKDEEQEDEETEEEEDEEEEKILSPQQKKARRYTAVLAAGFLLLCLIIGIFLGIRHVRELDRMEEEYQKSLEERQESQDGSPAEKGYSLRTTQEVDVSQYQKVTPVGAEADSQKGSGEEGYGAEKVIDGDQATSWQEGEEGTGEGKGIKINLDGTHQIRCLVLSLGNWRSDELWKYNARPKSLTIQIGEQFQKDVRFSDEKSSFCLVLEEPIDASFVSLTLQESYPGERWEDNCISEVEIYE